MELAPLEGGGGSCEGKWGGWRGCTMAESCHCTQSHVKKALDSASHLVIEVCKGLCEGIAFTLRAMAKISTDYKTKELTVTHPSIVTEP